MPVRERLLLVLPEKDLYEYLCTGCGASLGEREVSLAEKRQARASCPARRGGAGKKLHLGNRLRDMRIIFIGTGEIGLPALHALAKSPDIRCWRW